MKKEIIVQSSTNDTRVAVLENDQLVEIYIEETIGDRLVGSIFKGIVENVLPGMQAAFVDIGREKNTFLYVEDAIPDNSYGKNGVKINIRDILKVGQEVIVQVSKEPLGTKGARVTRQLTLPGRYLVLMPTVDYIGISRRIKDEKERERLQEVAEEIKHPNIGMIIRTVAVDATKEQLEEDLNFLVSVWKKIEKELALPGTKRLIHKDLQLVERILRDVVTEDVDKIIFNSSFDNEKIKGFLGKEFSKYKIVLTNQADIFAEYNVKAELANALKRKVWLKSGGYLIIDQTEALTSIDVNTGKFVGSIDLEDTVLKTNLEATFEIARQLRLRNLGGIIIIDFIDMQYEKNQEMVLTKLEQFLSRDKTKSNILGITSLNLVEMTRKKVRRSLSSIFETTCPCCDGKGRIFSVESVCTNIKDELMEVAGRTMAETIMIKSNPKIISSLKGQGERKIKELEQKIGKNILLRIEESLLINNYEIKAVHNIE
ncbi:RNAse G [Desulfonispora thiosulfatigenes DSM 11270]|uniref:Ribonuclease G n=1 Tax=Desulfonispora thiosulfatigenes DSM 11270 TaxID=656914 RepID=A0A1W1UH88_DESTI|nr:Rne/Rng family ribonuclease [Desulfonispora thiosulfatigenes]SMB80399.1 RNAse G [Desulfonispora thiosulfatigenes DSM 11270]